MLFVDGEEVGDGGEVGGEELRGAEFGVDLCRGRGTVSREEKRCWSWMNSEVYLSIIL